MAKQLLRNVANRGDVAPPGMQNAQRILEALSKSKSSRFSAVIPTKVGMTLEKPGRKRWVPAFAGMTISSESVSPLV
ncbi:MAG: hypothetical protein E6Q50_11640 [Lysobacter sp.]|nr:MAG: hypothetical protein E6Q50_11640 [Lysobacter sp.]